MNMLSYFICQDIYEYLDMRNRYKVSGVYCRDVLRNMKCVITHMQMDDNSLCVFRDLIYLGCCNNSHITDIGIIKHQSTLISLDCQECPQITSYGIGKLKYLTCLCCNNCNNITDKCVQKLKRLKYLYCQGCPKINGVCSKYLHNLVGLSCSDWTNHDNYLIWLPQLIYLRCTNCDQFTDKSLMFLTNLIELRCYRCDKITKKCILSLPHIKYFECRDCNGLQDVKCNITINRPYVNKHIYTVVNV